MIHATTTPTPTVSTDAVDETIHSRHLRPVELSRLAAQTLTPSDHLIETLDRIQAITPPLWPLADYVAVNPFLGLTDLPFLEARRLLREVRDCDILPQADHFRNLLDGGDITPTDCNSALQQCREEYPEWYCNLTVEQCLETIRDRQSTNHEASAKERRYFTIAEVIDAQSGSRWASHIVTDISRHCAAHYDHGQASWPSPWRRLPLFEAWRQRARISRRLDRLGIRGFRRFVETLPSSPTETIATLLSQLDVPDRHVEKFLLAQMFSVAGWASFIRQHTGTTDRGDLSGDDLLGLLAIRLTCDAGLASSERLQRIGTFGFPDDQPPTNSPALLILVRYLLQVAAETGYQRRLLSILNEPDKDSSLSKERPTLQMVFCIDVRSEVYRRHLEAQHPTICTSGFAGFFGIPLEFIPLGTADGTAQCPVLLKPSLQVPEGLAGGEFSDLQNAVQRRQRIRMGNKLWKAFQTSAVSCFSFVEALGLTYFPKLLSDSLGLTRPVPNPKNDGLTAEARARLAPDLTQAQYELPLKRRIDLAEGMLRNLGMTEHFASIVVLCGHASDMTNNPYRAGYDCGACGGHSGEPNARVAAALLNDTHVRTGLTNRGLFIPADTWFVPAVHHTTTDQIEFHDLDLLPERHAEAFAEIKTWTDRASTATRLERSIRLGASSGDSLAFRSRDWSEVRPEWGLAGNAAFIVANRHRTQGVDLGGRVFLHDYDSKKDAQEKVLELIMTAPMVVTSWINLQYYASAVDNRSFGSGDKVIHDVVGQFGIQEGNGGDLMTGLPWQALHDGEKFQHDPLRLLVVIEATRDSVSRILEIHSGIHDLICHGWIRLIVRDGNTHYRFTPSSEWSVF